MELGAVQGLKGRRRLKSGSNEFDRHEVLLLLWKNAQWLDEHIHKKQLKLTPALKQRVYMVQVQSGLCKTLLYGLKDEELELRIEQLEKALGNSVVIPKEKQK